jgi:hypothetical protein
VPADVELYGVEVRSPLITFREIYECSCVLRLAAILREQLGLLRDRGAVKCSSQVAGKLAKISLNTIYCLLTREREVRCLRRERNSPVHSLLYQRVPTKGAHKWDQHEAGNCSWILCCIADAQRRASMW